MKYMGSKRAMLQNGLGELLRTESRHCERIVDLFCGAGSVSWFSAQEFEKPVYAVDLQKFAIVLAQTIVERTSSLDSMRLKHNWIESARLQRCDDELWGSVRELDKNRLNAGTWAKRARSLCASESNIGPIWQAYGGYYYSPMQALTIDYLIKCLPIRGESRTACLAATIMAASQCAAAPGHTAQPFSPSRTAGKYLREAWCRDPLQHASNALDLVCNQYAKSKGKARIGNAVDEACGLMCNDLVFIDPPYSGVHYSRFYHVLETIARGSCGPVSGTGRYPPPAERPVSSFSRKSESISEFSELMMLLSVVGCTVIVTFPAGKCSNGLSGNDVEQIAAQVFRIKKRTVKTSFSTLGGNINVRAARQKRNELILLLKPK